MPRFKKTLRFVALTCVLALSAADRSEASRVRPIGLSAMTERAQRIFAGRCTTAEVVIDQTTGIRSTQVTFEVSRWIKGPGGPTPTLTVHLFGDVREGSKDTWAGMVRFAPGEEVILFLDGNSAYGLTRPIGLTQGKLSVVPDKFGRKVAVPPLGLSAFMSDAPAGAQDLLSVAALGEGVKATALLEVVDQMVRRKPFALEQK